MFRREDILVRLQTQPFQPLRIIASEGLRYEIRHPDLVMVTHRDLVIGHDSPEHPGVPDRITIVALVHVVAIEMLPVDASGTKGAVSG
jgi:hypothetical protein